MDQPTDISVEWISKRIYWSEFRFGTIMCSSFDGSNETVIIQEEYHPLSITVNSLTGYIFNSLPLSLSLFSLLFFIAESIGLQLELKQKFKLLGWTEQIKLFLLNRN